MRDDAALAAWVSAQTYIALGTMMATASLLSIDNGPMEGFDPAKVDEILGLSGQHLHAVSMLALGYRGEDPMATSPKVRRTKEEVVAVVA
jgi:nitroreductase